MTPTITTRLRDDRGFGAVETAIAAPLVLAVLALLIAAARLASANLGVDSAASAAARAASLERSGPSASGAAHEAANSTLSQRGTTCTNIDVAPDTSGFATPAGTRSSVTVTVTCTVSLADLVAPGMPGTKTITSTATSPIDRFRGRQ